MDSVQAAFLFRLASQVLSATMGSMAIFCLYYAGQVSNPNLVWVLLTDVLIWGGAPSAIVYSKNKYLD